MDLQNKLIIRKRISEKGPYIEGIELAFKDIIKLFIRCIKGNKINIFVFDENDEYKTHNVYFSYEMNNKIYNLTWQKKKRQK